MTSQKVASPTVSNFFKIGKISEDDSMESEPRTPTLRKVRRRLLHKHGEYNIYHNHLRKRGQRFLADIFTTLVDCQWRYILFAFVAAFYLSWLGFGVIWWLICLAHGDFTAENQADTEYTPCVTGMSSFASALLFSIETQHTIGYGSRYTTEECPEAIFLMMLQSCYGVIVQAMMAGLVFAKLTRPKKRAETLLFSKNAVICMRDGQLCLLFRVGDMRTKSQLVDAHVRAYLVRKYETEEGETIPLHRHNLDVGMADGSDRLIVSWPTLIVHRIDENSPLWYVDATELETSHFEIIAFLEATIETTGMTVQARSSFVPEEILWGHRFESLEYFNPDSGRYGVDFNRFHNTIVDDTPKMSAMMLSRISQENEETSSADLSGSEDQESAASIQDRNSLQNIFLSVPVMQPRPVLST